jgi:hypothetical protein
MIYEIQKWGVTLEWTRNLEEAETAFKKANWGGVVFYQIKGSQKRAVKAK